MKHQIKWNLSPGQFNAWFTDIPGIARYEVKKVHRTNTWVAYRNGEPTSLKEDSLQSIKKAVENVIMAVMK